ncbi:hypothetical protein LCGC14_0292110 [marine sediment metagenome]|uniref:DUF302 domain-containing protein n=1 Tax=marine sediment metagenome TaxID=412755 RepID=A0A0F9WYL0_9ZZZZ|nr:DUF302 domain-containing protein [Maribacter sp.]HDZ06209.1 DUF302 domain-containing protein [Maribacter sp.]
MKSAIIHKLIERPFNDVYEIILKNIIAHGFLVLHEINTQSIVGKHGITIKPLKQILFFHPDYIKKITNQDILAINEIPIKIVISEEKNGVVNVSFPNPETNLRDYNLDLDIGNELLNRTLSILEI